MKPLRTTMVRSMLLNLISERPGISQVDMSRAMFISQQGLANLMGQLQSEGLVGNGRDPRLARRKAYYLTTKGEDVVGDYRKSVLALHLAARGQLQAHEIDDLIQKLAKLRLALSQSRIFLPLN